MPSAPPLPTWRAALLKGVRRTPAVGEKIAKEERGALGRLSDPFGGMGGKSLEGGEHFSLRHPEKS